MPGNCGLIDHIAGDIVNQGWERWQDYATDAFEDAQEFTQQLSYVVHNLKPITTDIELSVTGELGTPFTAPAAPAAPDLTYTRPAAPSDPAIDTGIAITTPEAPTFTGTAPAINMPVAPGPLDAQAPTDAPTLTDVTLPDAPVITLPEVPTLRDITLPDAPSLMLPAFTASAPLNDLVAPGQTFSFSEADYSSDMLDALQARVTAMLAGGTGLPDAIWSAIWDRGRAREAETGHRALQEAIEEWAARGFSLPGGALDAKIQAVRQSVQNAENTLSREIAIEQAKMEVENLRFAVTQGLALVNLTSSLYMQKMQRAFEAARYAFEAGIHIFNAKVTLYNASVQAYAVEAQVYRDLIQAETLKLEQYKAQLEGQQLIGQLNEQDVRIYIARLEGVTKAIEVYRAQLAGVQTQVEVDKARVDAFQALVQAYGEQVRAKQTEIQAFAERIRGELGKAQVYEAEVGAFANLVRAHQSTVETEIAKADTKIRAEDLKIRKFAAFIDKFRAELQAEAERVRSGTMIYDAQSRLYAAQVGAEEARVRSETTRFQAAVEEARARETLELEEARLNIEQIQRLLTLEIEAIKAVMTTKSQLAAAAMSAVSLQAQISEQAQNSTNCSTQYNYQM